MTPNPSRRWLRFNLRGLLILVTVLCCWLGWESSVVRTRLRLMRTAQAEGYDFVFPIDWQEVDILSISPSAVYLPGPEIPRIRRFLGDKPVQAVFYYEFESGYSEKRLQELVRAFPEATFQARLRGTDYDE